MALEKLEKIIRKHALKNAFSYGKASTDSIIGKVIAEFPKSKENLKEMRALVSKIVEKINKMEKSEIENELKKYVFIEKKPEIKTLSFPNAIPGRVVVRFAPEPSGYPHIGHAKALFLNYECAKIYNGKLILRFDDTNPEREDAEFIDAIKQGLIWLGVKWDVESYTSDNLPMLYEYAEKAIEKNAVYVCTCKQEIIRENREKQKACACRNLEKDKTLTQWKKMFSEFKQGEAILRLKGDLSSSNTVMRDPTLFRIIEVEHYKQGKKYRVWPTYDFASVIMDWKEKITHVMRSKEYELRDKLYTKIIEIFELEKPEIIGFSRLAIKNTPLSKRLITPLVEQGKVMGWNDPRLPTLAGLEKRGILPDAVKNFVSSFGLSKVESNPSWEKLLAENKKMLEPISKHYFFVPDPIKLKIKNTKAKEAELRFHPSIEMGTRKIAVSDFVYIPKNDFEKIKNREIFRLKDLYNVKMISKEDREVEFVEAGIVDKKLQWVADYIEIDVLKPGELLNNDETFNENSLEKIKGYAEANISNIKQGEIVQFERFGFCRLEKKNERYVFIYSC